MTTSPRTPSALALRAAALLAAPLLVFGLAACTGSDASGSGASQPSAAGEQSNAEAEPQEHVVTINGLKWVPAEIEIAVGDTVVWHMDAGGMAHDVVSDDELFVSELMTEGEFRHTFTEVGEYGYDCTPHPMMVGTVTVVDR